MTLRTAMRFGDFSKNISKPLDRKEKSYEIRDIFLRRKVTKCVSLI